MNESLVPEWSHKIDVDDIGSTSIRTSISASPQERKDLARRLNVVSIDFLEAVLVMKRESGNRIIHVEGHFKAKVTQSCVVTLDPVQQEIEGEAEGWFASPESAVSLARARQEKRGRSADAELPILDEQDDPEPVVDGQIDLGELVTQYLSLSINPYPHKDGVQFEPAEDYHQKTDGNRVRQNPFAALKDWKIDKKKEK